MTLQNKLKELLDKRVQLDLDLSRKLPKSILQEAIQGKLVPQDPAEGTAEELMQQIKAEKVKLVKEGKLKKQALADSTIYKGVDNRYWEKLSNGTVKCIDDEIPFDIPDSWMWVRGKQIFLPMESIKPSKDFLYVDVDAVNNEQHYIDNPKFISLVNAPSRATRKLHSNDILFSLVRPYLRNIALVTEPFKDAIASTGFYVITPYKAIFPKFLYYLMLSNYVVDGLNVFMKGDNSPSINNCHIENYPYPIPPLKEQCRIVTQVERLLDMLQ